MLAAPRTVDVEPVRGQTDLDAKRRCYPLREYIRAASALRTLYGASHVLLVTDSPATLNELRRNEEARQFTWEWLDVRRQVKPPPNRMQPPRNR